MDARIECQTENPVRRTEKTDPSVQSLSTRIVPLFEYLPRSALFLDSLHSKILLARSFLRYFRRDRGKKSMEKSYIEFLPTLDWVRHSNFSVIDETWWYDTDSKIFNLALSSVYCRGFIAKETDGSFLLKWICAPSLLFSNREEARKSRRRRRGISGIFLRFTFERIRLNGNEL